MKVNGLMIRNKALVMNYSKMEINMKDIIMMANLKEEVIIAGIMVKPMMANGKKEKNTDLVYGKVQKVIPIQVNGKKELLMDMVSIFGSMVYINIHINIR